MVEFDLVRCCNRNLRSILEEGTESGAPLLATRSQLRADDLAPFGSWLVTVSSVSTAESGNWHFASSENKSDPTAGPRRLLQCRTGTMADALRFGKTWPRPLQTVWERRISNTQLQSAGCWVWRGCVRDM